MTVATDSMTMVTTKSGAGPDTSTKADTTEVEKADLAGMMEIGGLKEVAEEALPVTDAQGGHGVSADCAMQNVHTSYSMIELTIRSCLMYLLGFLNRTL